MSAAQTDGVLLLCLDLQEALLAAIPDRERLLRRCRLAISAAQGLGVRIAFTEQVPQKLGSTATELVEAAGESVRFEKSTFSALSDAAFEKYLRRQEIEHLLICGVETSVCVYQTAIDAINHNLQATILSDAVACRRAEDGAVALSALVRGGAHLLPVETIFYSLLHDATHPFFKRFTQLVKSHV